MPTAGDEGYEKMIVCPYDRSHEIRKGRMQFHLEKCRQNFPMSQLMDCPYNKSHQVLRQEMQYHIEEECRDRCKWETFTHESSSVECPVKELVPVNAASVPDGGENWDSVETPSNVSVLQKIKAEAETKPIVRLCQVKSKATKKAFRKAERERFENVSQGQYGVTTESSASSLSKLEPLPRPTVQSNIKVYKQDPEKALATIQKQFRTLDLSMKSSQGSGSVAPSETSSMNTGPPSEYAASVVSSQISYAAASQSKPSRPPSVWSNETTDTSFMTALTSQHGRVPRMSTAMSERSFATASRGASPPRSPSAMSSASRADSIMSMNTVSSIGRPPGSTHRPTAAMNIAASAAAYMHKPDPDEEGFSQIPIPGLGRGRKPKPKN